MLKFEEKKSVAKRLNVKKFCTLGLIAIYLLVRYDIIELLQSLRSVEYCETDLGLY